MFRERFNNLESFRDKLYKTTLNVLWLRTYIGLETAEVLAKKITDELGKILYNQYRWGKRIKYNKVIYEKLCQIIGLRG